MYLTAAAISAGEEIVINYVTFIHGTQIRREKLKVRLVFNTYVSVCFTQPGYSVINCERPRKFSNKTTDYVMALTLSYN